MLVRREDLRRPFRGRFATLCLSSPAFREADKSIEYHMRGGAIWIHIDGVH
jgi:hypothetical protein